MAKLRPIRINSVIIRVLFCIFAFTSRTHREDIQLVSPVKTIVPREPVRTTLRFAASAPLRSAPSGVRSGTHSCPNVSTGKHCFKTEVLLSRATTLLMRRRKADTRMVLYSQTHIVERRNVAMRVSVNVQLGMLGPSLSRNCPAVLYNFGTSSTICNACTFIFVRLFRNC